MWRKLTIMLLLLILAQTANASPGPEIVENKSLNHVSFSQAEFH